MSSLGWSPNLLATVTWGIGGATAGLAGILLAPNAGLSLSVFTIVVTVSALAVALDRWVQLVPAHLARRRGARDRRERGPDLLERHLELPARHLRDRERRHRTAARAAVPRDRRRARGPREGAAAAQPRPREASRPRHRGRHPLVPRRRRRRAAAPQRLRVRRRLVDRGVHLADRRRVHPLDRRAHGLRRAALAGAVRDRWTGRAVRVAPRRRRALARRARLPRGRRVRDPRGRGLRHPGAANPGGEPRGRHARARASPSSR